MITYSEGKERRLIHADECERVFDYVVDNASKIGMKVNCKKTQLLCVSPLNCAEVTSYFISEGETITSGSNMKMLGFVVDNKGSATAHVKHIVKKTAKRIWILTHLKRAGINQDQLRKIYTAIIRPVIEYGCQLYHYLLTGDQREALERLQRRAMRIICPAGTSYTSALEMLEIPRLEERRIELCKKFTLKAADNPSYASWFPLNPEICHSLRKRKRYLEETAQTTRRLKSPIFMMRKILNAE